MDPKITNIIFDMGGVLIEWRPQLIASRFSSDPKLQEVVIQDIFGHEDWLVWDSGSITHAELMDRAAKRTGIPLAEVKRLMALSLESLDAIQPTVDLLRELKAQGYRIYCLSNMPLEHYEILKGTLDFWSDFDGVVISSQAGLSKPDPAIYRHLLDEFQLDPATCLFLDDYQGNVDAARKLGIHALLYRGADDCRRQLPALLG